MSLTVAQLVARLSADTSGFYKGMAVANASMVRTGTIVNRVAAGAGLATIAMGYMSLRAAGNFQEGMNLLQAVSGATENQMGKLRKEAIRLGADLKLPNTSAKDAAAAMVELSKGGLTVNQILKSTRGTIQLAIAANISMADAATINARALKAFNLDGSQAGKIANLLAAGANKSTAEITDLALGIQNASAQFSGAHYPISSLVIALSELADKGLAGTLGGTALKVMLQRLENPTTKAAAQMKKLGVDIADSTGKIRPLGVIIGQFQKGLKELNPIQQQQALNTIFGARANQAMLKLVELGTKGWKNYTKAIVGTNAAQKLTEARTKGFNGALQGFQSAVETLAIQLGTALLPSMTRAVRSLSRFIETIDPNKIIAFFAAIISGVRFMYDFIHSSNTLSAAVAALLAGLIAYRVAMEAVAIYTRVAAVAQAIFNAAIKANPIVRFITVAVALAAALYVLYQRSETVRNAVNGMASYLQKTLVPVFDWVRAKITAWATWFKNLWNTIRYDLKNNVGGITTDLHKAWENILTALRAAFHTVEAIFHAVWPTLSVYLKGIWRTMKLEVEYGIKAIRDVLNIVLGLLSGDWGRAWDGLKSLVKDTLTGAFKIAWSILRTAADTAYKLAVTIGKQITVGILHGLGDLVSSVGNKIHSGLTGAVHWAGSKLTGSGEYQWTAHTIGTPMGQAIIRGYLLGIRNLPSSIETSLRDAFENGKRVVDREITEFQSRFSKLADYANQAFDSITSQHLTPAGKMLEGIISAHDQQQLNQSLVDAQNAVADAQQKIADVNNASYDNEKDRLSALSQARDEFNNALAAQTEAEYQIRVAALQKVAAQQQKEYLARRNLQKQHLDDMLAIFEQKMATQPERAKFWQEKIIKTLRAYGINYKSAGHAVGEAFAQGLREAEGAIYDEATRIANTVARILKTHSPAKEGPLSDLDKWWSPFASTLLEGLRTGDIRSAVERLAGQARAGIGAPGALGLSNLLPGQAGTGRTLVLQVTVPVHGSVITEHELGQYIRGVIADEARLGRSLIPGPAIG